MFDAHIHLDELKAHQFGQSLWKDSEYRALVPGVTPEQTRKARASFADDPRIVLASAVHPWWVMDLDADATPDSSPVFNELCTLSAESWVVAVGETGLDHVKCPPDHPRYEQQQQFFRAHAELALSLNKPLIVHAVRCHAAVYDVLAPCIKRGLAVMIHAYAGSDEETKRYATLGCSLSVGPPVTREKSRRIREAAAAIPNELLLIETDAPAMAAGEKRGRGEGCVDDIQRVCDTVAELRGEEATEVRAVTRRNARRFFGLGDSSVQSG